MDLAFSRMAETAKNDFMSILNFVRSFFMKARIKNLIVPFSLEGLGILVIVDSYKQGLRTFSDPGAGFFPFLLGILLCLFTIPIWISSVKDLKRLNKIKNEEKGIEYRTNLKQQGTAAAYLIGYFLLLDILGFGITTFLFLFGLFWIGYPRKWMFISILSATIVALAYLIFNIFLKVSLPSGFWTQIYG